MRYLKNTSFITIFTIALFAGLFVVAPAQAQASNLEVVFQAEPLFYEANFLPGSGVTRTVEVGNNSGEEQRVVVEAINAVDGDGLGDELSLVIKEGATTLYENTLGAFLRAGEVELSPLSSSASTTYSFGVTFDSDSDNDTQATTLGFDLCVGFEGGDTNCGDTVAGGEGDIEEGGDVSGEGASSPGTGNSGGGGGGGGKNIIIEISGETVAETDTDSGTALIEWETNYLSTSQVIYGLKNGPDAPYSINLTVSPYFGYPIGTVEDFNKTTSHSVSITGLILGEEYVFRVVSRASPPTVGYEKSFKFVEGGGIEPKPIFALAPDGGGEVEKIIAGGIEGGGVGIPGLEDNNLPVGGDREEEITEEETVSQNVAAAFFGFPKSLFDWLKYIIILLLIISIIYIILTQRKKRNN